MIEKCPNCGAIVESVALLSNPPIYKKICKNCGEITPEVTNISCGLCSFNCDKCNPNLNNKLIR